MQDDGQVKLLLAKRSLEAWNDAHAPEGVLSEGSRIDALFDAGYFVLLALAPRDARQLLEHHPDVDFVRTACAAMNVSAEVGIRYAENKYAAFDDERPTAEQVRSWAVELRATLA